jgi:hypothetical protein
MSDKKVMPDLSSLLVKIDPVQAYSSISAGLSNSLDSLKDCFIQSHLLSESQRVIVNDFTEYLRIQLKLSSGVIRAMVSSIVVSEQTPLV